ncbi:biopolymer transporter ExbD [Desulfonatronovibrio magnus]|uniref:biopolymer transporter ExbD n=1 Tax=Desulfonatronovibrio magnus TaxID=698827 RepID=UPI0005EB4B85|nr:biopolymer transporter ExbD [Desulfonatronovibrio magnus]
MDFDPLGKGFITQTNVTPIVDVMLVLLIIFMITAPMLTQGLEVDLPRTTTVETLPQDHDNLVISIDRENKISIDEYEVELSQIATHLERIVQDRDRLVYLRADEVVPYGLVVNVMSRIKEAGIDRLGVVALPEED